MEKREYTRREKLANWFYYNKLWVFVGAVVAYVVGSMIWNVLGIGVTAPDYCVAYVGAQRLPEDCATALEDALAASAILVLMVFSVWWPQIVLFEQKPGIQLKNCILFSIQNFWPTLGVAALQFAWWVLFVIFLPWTAFLVPVLGVWYLWFLCCFLLYDRLDGAFRIEEQIQDAFPELFQDEE